MELLGLALAASMIFLFMRGTRHEQHRRQRSRERREAMVAQWLGELTKLLVHRADATLDHALQHFRAVHLDALISELRRRTGEDRTPRLDASVEEELLRRLEVEELSRQQKK